MKKRKLTSPTQQKLVNFLQLFMGQKEVPYDTIKKVANLQTFDQTFNTLLEKGWVERVPTNDFSNKFKLT